MPVAERLQIGASNEHISNRARQRPIPGDSQGVAHVGRTSHRSSVYRARRPHLLSGMLHSRLPRHGEASAAPRSGVPRTRLVGHCSGRCEGKSRRRSRHRTGRRRCAVDLGTGHQSRRNDRRFPGQGPARPLRGGYLFAGISQARVPNRSADIRCRHPGRPRLRPGDLHEAGPVPKCYFIQRANSASSMARRFQL